MEKAQQRVALWQERLRRWKISGKVAENGPKNNRSLTQPSATGGPNLLIRLLNLLSNWSMLQELIRSFNWSGKELLFGFPKTLTSVP